MCVCVSGLCECDQLEEPDAPVTVHVLPPPQELCFTLGVALSDSDVISLLRGSGLGSGVSVQLAGPPAITRIPSKQSVLFVFIASLSFGSLRSLADHFVSCLCVQYVGTRTASTGSSVLTQRAAVGVQQTVLASPARAPPQMMLLGQLCPVAALVCVWLPPESVCVLQGAPGPHAATVH